MTIDEKTTKLSYNEARAELRLMMVHESTTPHSLVNVKMPDGRIGTFINATWPTINVDDLVVVHTYAFQVAHGLSVGVVTEVDVCPCEAINLYPAPGEKAEDNYMARLTHVVNKVDTTHLVLITEAESLATAMCQDRLYDEAVGEVEQVGLTAYDSRVEEVDAMRKHYDGE